MFYFILAPLYLVNIVVTSFSSPSFSKIFITIVFTLLSTNITKWTSSKAGSITGLFYVYESYVFIYMFHNILIKFRKFI